MTNQDIQIIGDEGTALAGALVPSSHRPAGVSRGTVIQFQAHCRRPRGLDASSLDMFESLGELAIKLVADWSLPRLSCWRQGEETHRQHSS
jgi:hypothetical protein